VGAQLLKHGSPLSEKLWHKLLIFSLDKDLVIYVRLAYERGIYLHNVDEEGKFSFHAAVCCNAKKVIAFLGETFGYQTMRRIGMTPDSKAMTAVDYANISNDLALQELVSQVIGDKLLQVKPKSLLEVEENLERENLMETQSLLNTKYSGVSSKLGIQPKKPELKPSEQAIFDKTRFIDTANKAKANTVSADFIEQQKAMKTQRELETQKKYL
jgi:hypothetical protein